VGLRLRDLCVLSVSVPVDQAGQPATEIRLFHVGLNTTENGDWLFDSAAAESVMAAYAKHGVPVMIDLEHLSLDELSPHYDPRARGRAQLSLRNGELWLVGIKWTPDGTARIVNGEETFLSPAFHVDSDNRVTKVFNVGLVAQPATDFAMPLAASMNHRGNKMDPKMLRKLAENGSRLVELTKSGKSIDDALQTCAIDPKVFAGMAKLLGADANDMGAVIAAVRSWLDEFQAAATGKSPEKPKDEPTPDAAPDAAPEAMRAAGGELKALRSETDKLNRELQVLRADRDAREAAERRELVAELVKLGRETPATAWADESATRPRGSLATMAVTELQERVAAFRKLGGIRTTGDVRPNTAGTVESTDGIEIDPFELARVKRAHDAVKLSQLPHGMAHVTPEAAIARYREIKGQQLSHADAKGDRRMCQMIARRLTEADVILDAGGRLNRSNLVTLSTPVKPLEEFGATSQRALEEFRLEYMSVLASLPQTWAETIGRVLPGGSLKDTYPIDFAVSKYRIKIAETAAAATANVKEISVTKDLYHAAEECELYRLRNGDFAYIRSWDAKAGRMARARQFLRNHLVATLLEANGNWVDGKAFFATDHWVDPFNHARTFRGATGWSNYQNGTAAPLGSSVLTAEKGLFLYGTPGLDGEEMGFECDALLFPTILNETSRNLLTVQDLILDDTGTSGVRNPHYQSGMEMVRAPELTGTAVTANWYLFSRAAIGTGLDPWVVAEDAQEEVVVWDESSDFYKNGTGFIKYESRIRVGALLVYPHAMRRVDGT